MTPQEAEAQIGDLVRVIDAVRLESLYTDEQKAEKIREIENKIKDLKQITGPRHISGSLIK